MNTMDRRKFFKNIVNVKGSSKNIKAGSLIELGRLSDFPINSVNEFELQGQVYCLRSLPEGLVLTEINEKTSYRLSINSRGVLMAHLDEPQGDRRGMSVLTGEMVSI